MTNEMSHRYYRGIQEDFMTEKNAAAQEMSLAAASMGRLGGKSKSVKKLKSSNENLKKAWLSPKRSRPRK